MSLPRIPLWAKLANFAVDLTKPWGTGTSPTKVAPPQGLIDQGDVPDTPYAAEYENWQKNTNAIAARYTMLLAVKPVRKGVFQPAMVFDSNATKANGLNTWNTLSSVTPSNSAFRMSVDLETTYNTQVDANFAGATSSAGTMCRSISADDDSPSQNIGIVYQPQSTHAISSFGGSFGNPIFDNVLLTLSGNLRWGIGQGVKQINGSFLIPTYDFSTSQGSFQLCSGASIGSNFAYSVGAAGNKSALCTAQFFKHSIIAGSVQPIYVVTQNQSATGNKCVVMSISNVSGTPAQTLLYEGAELFGAGLNLYGPPVWDEDTQQWIFAASQSNTFGGSGGFKIFGAPLNSPHTPTLIYDSATSGSVVENVSILRMASLGGGVIVAWAIKSSGDVVGIIASFDSGASWQDLNCDFYQTNGGNFWSVIGDTAFNSFCVNQSKRGHTTLGGITGGFAQTAEANVAVFQLLGTQFGT